MAAILQPRFRSARAGAFGIGFALLRRRRHGRCVCFLPSPIEACNSADRSCQRTAYYFRPFLRPPLSALVFKVVMDSAGNSRSADLFGRLDEGESVTTPLATATSVWRGCFASTQTAGKDRKRRAARSWRRWASFRRHGRLPVPGGQPYPPCADGCLQACDSPWLCASMRRGGQARRGAAALSCEDPTLSVVRDEGHGPGGALGMGELIWRSIGAHGPVLGMRPRTGKPVGCIRKQVPVRRGDRGVPPRAWRGAALWPVRLAVEHLARGQGREVRVGIDVRVFRKPGWRRGVGHRRGLACGVLGGYPVQDVRLRVLDLPPRGQSSRQLSHGRGDGAQKRACEAGRVLGAVMAGWLTSLIPLSARCGPAWQQGGEDRELLDRGGTSFPGIRADQADVRFPRSCVPHARASFFFHELQIRCACLACSFPRPIGSIDGMASNVDFPLSGATSSAGSATMRAERPEPESCEAGAIGARTVFPPGTGERHRSLM